MEWRKAIIILIISFTALNLFMGFNLWFIEKPTAEFDLTLDEKQEIEETLRKRGVILKGDIPEIGRPQAFLEVGFNTLDEKKVVEDFLGKDQHLETSHTQEGRRYTLGNRQLIITGSGLINYFDNAESILWPNLTREQAEIEAANFMQTHGGMPEQAVLDKVTFDEKSKGYLLEYVRYYDDFFIDNSYITILVTPSGVKSYYQCWLSPFNYTGKKRQVISPLTAILRVISEVNTEPINAITHIGQGYYSKYYDADRWQAVPVWKIVMEDGDSYYVNAYTGEMEQ